MFEDAGMNGKPSPEEEWERVFSRHAPFSVGRPLLDGFLRVLHFYQKVRLPTQDRERSHGGVL